MSAIPQDRFCAAVQSIRKGTIAAFIGLAVMAGVLSGAACGCSSNPGPTPSPNFSLTAQQVARATVLSAESAWEESETVCKSLAQMKMDDSIRQKCSAVLDPIVPMIVTAARLSDAWQDANEGQMACLAGDILAAWPKIQAIITGAGGTVPPVVNDAIQFASMMAPKCTRPAADAGTASNVDTLQSGHAAADQSTSSITSADAVITAIGGN